jgi:hypothetical protein
LNQNQAAVVAAVRARVPHSATAMVHSGSGSGASFLAAPIPLGGNRSRTSSATNNSSNNNNTNTNISNIVNHYHENKDTIAGIGGTGISVRRVGGSVTPPSPIPTSASSSSILLSTSPPRSSSLSPMLISPADSEKGAREMVKSLEAEITKEHNRLMEMIASDGGGSVICYSKVVFTKSHLLYIPFLSGCCSLYRIYHRHMVPKYWLLTQVEHLQWLLIRMVHWAYHLVIYNHGTCLPVPLFIL